MFQRLLSFAMAGGLSLVAAWGLPRFELNEWERARVLKQAEAALQTEPVTITAFRAKLSEGGRNDFYSNGDYWWPNPNTADGLPYVQRDGESNPDNFVEHRRCLIQLRDSVAALGAGYRLSGEDRYAAKAASMLRVFFLDPGTRMNPRLSYAQAIPGVTAGRGIGIIDTLHLAEIPLAVRAMEGSPSFPREVLSGLNQWFQEYLNWMITSGNGRDEANAGNNHAVAYWLQVACFSRLTGDEARLSECRRRFKEVFVARQMAADGSFPAELRRTKPYGYSIFQLDNMASLCQVVSTLEDDLWRFEMPDGRGMNRAMKFLYPYLADKTKWPYKPDIQAWDGWPCRQPSLLFAGLALPEESYLALWKKLPPDPSDPEVRRNMAVTQPVLWFLPGSNPVPAMQAAGTLRDCLRPARRSGGFQMEGYMVWCPSVLKVNETYHLFASRWPEHYGMGGWTQHSECIRATSSNLLGPYVFQEVVLQKRPENWDNTRVHNGRVVRAGSKFLLYYIDSANEAGLAVADDITGPWVRRDKPLMRVSNPAAFVKPDGSVYVFGRLRDGREVNGGRAFIARSYEGPYRELGNGKNLLPEDAELEDPTIWWANNQFNVLVNDWKGNVTGISKAGAQYCSFDGVHYQLMSSEPVFTKTVAYEDGTFEAFQRRERPFVFVNEKQEVVALFTACLPSSGPSRVVAQAVDRYFPENPRRSMAEPKVYLLDAKHLVHARERLRLGDERFAAALKDLLREADAALNAKLVSVMDKKLTPPSGDKHDYMSQAPYFWPDPKSSNGLPYIRRDGERNPEIGKISDHGNILSMPEKVQTLALAWHFTGEERYAAKAAEFLRAWFLDPKTRMNPHFKYAQGIPGVNTGRGIGLIESRGLTKVVDAVGLLAASKSWTPADEDDLKQWFRQFLTWMRESDYGRDEAAAKNNHGTYYDLQVVSFALFIGDDELARETLTNAKQKRIAVQVEPDGTQPLELVRTRAWSYSTGNLSGLMSLADLGKRVGVDLWGFGTTDGRSISRALDYLIPFGSGEKPWPHAQIGGWSSEGFGSLVRRAAVALPDGQYRDLAVKLAGDKPSGKDLLLLPELPSAGSKPAMP